MRQAVGFAGEAQKMRILDNSVKKLVRARRREAVFGRQIERRATGSDKLGETIINGDTPRTSHRLGVVAAKRAPDRLDIVPGRTRGGGKRAELADEAADAESIIKRQHKIYP